MQARVLKWKKGRTGRATSILLQDRNPQVRGQGNSSSLKAENSGSSWSALSCRDITHVILYFIVATLIKVKKEPQVKLI